MMPRLTIYAAYRGDDYIATGNKYELSNILGVLPETIKWYASKACQRKREGVKGTDRQVHLVRLDEEELLKEESS